MGMVYLKLVKLSRGNTKFKYLDQRQKEVNRMAVVKDVDKLIGRNLRRIRESKNISQKELAKLINTLSVRLSAYEAGREGMGKDIMMRICRVLGVRPYEFFLEEDTPVVEDKAERELIQIIREARKYNNAVAENIYSYGKFVIAEIERTGHKNWSCKDREANHKDWLNRSIDKEL